ASAYVGSYTATATCGGDTMTDPFKVTAGAEGGGDDNGNGGGDNGDAGNGGGDDGNQLPRTGADLGGLTTGALLLLVGGAAIALTGRKNKFGRTPTSF
ncbi:MAG: LPXTG cell wall anchor domain-containing protein, partial [Brevibacterium linens]|uniref:LPXTG cell wall anchor domain-containing protein n=1 Tax=Brevibacterium linens TaxID=1703 RepID=UPI003F98A4CA